MFYVTTRSDRETFTPYRAMTADRAPDGGWFIPMERPCLTGLLHDAAGRSFNDNVAVVLNLLCGAELTGRDIDLVSGKHTVEQLPLTSRTMVAEIWHNLDCDFSGYVDRLFRLTVQKPEGKLGQWFAISVRIAVLFAVFAELTAVGYVCEESPLDIAVPSFDFQFPMAAWYARSWGLPIGTIICACNENNAPWCLIHQGQMRTDVPVRATGTPACDQALPAGLERLICGTLGMEEAVRFGTAAAEGQPYEMEAEQQRLLRSGISVSMVSQRRMAFMLPNLYRTGIWKPDLYAAMAFTALVDHRAAPGDTGRALVISEESPVWSAGLLSQYLGMSAEKLAGMLEKG